MFEFRAFQNTQKSSKESILNQPEKRDQVCRRVSFDTKYLGMGKCIDKRKDDRRTADRFNEEEYERLCKERLGPGWL